MLNAENLRGQEAVPAHEAARDRYRRAVEYRLNQNRMAVQFNSPSRCPFCQAPLRYDRFLAHVEVCPEAANDPQKKLLAIHEFNSGPHVFHRELQKLREACEVSFLEAKLDPGKLANMACRLCKSIDEHLCGGCLSDQQKSVFDLESNKIAARVLVHFEQYLNLKMQIAVKNLTQEHEQYFDSIGGLLNGELADMKAWSKIEETTRKHHIEKTKLINDLFAENQKQYESFQAEVKRTVERSARDMRAHLSSNQRNVHNLHRVIAIRRRVQAVEEVEQDQPNVMGEEEAAQLAAMLANIKIPEI
ncbi:CBN-EKL-5 protein [Caenorhabditis brenneri]|uniref:CBN-EKL-5 protein n=1 Tax=Caenorhabditis brenneri TaxID=135651 RepID=G0MCN1_CAEBE|nr:CBN-EKL-5 protein [Caenorhabditis brenneri]